MNVNCGVCKTICTVNHDCILCELCETWHHACCENLDKEKLKKMGQDDKPYICTICKSTHDMNILAMRLTKVWL
uniref:Zinc finger PHD-type domain-containing protein n=1 Tax=Ciona intestinalis TaxID=7719 RepID=H2XYY2_CIOIN